MHRLLKFQTQMFVDSGEPSTTVFSIWHVEICGAIHVFAKA